MKKVSKKILDDLYCPPSHSYKGKNGRLLIVAGSKKYHGALVLCSIMSAKIVDFVYVHTTKDNFDLIKKMREKLAEFIYINGRDLKHTTKEADTILIGPGLMPNKKSERLVRRLLKQFPEKKFLLDAGALRVVTPKLLHENCVITPHKQEFKSLFKQDPSVEVAQEISKNCPATIILKGATDYICQNGQVFYNKTGNVGLTKGGTGDVLSGLLASLMTKNDILTAAQSAVYINGLAGDKLFEKVGRYYSASELIPEVQKILKRY